MLLRDGRCVLGLLAHDQDQGSRTDGADDAGTGLLRDGQDRGWPSDVSDLGLKMSGVAKINHRGFEILHYHAGKFIIFQAYKGSYCAKAPMEGGRRIQKHTDFIDRENPLSDEERDWLCGVDHGSNRIEE